MKKRKRKLPIQPMFKPGKIIKTAVYVAGAGLALGLGMKAFKDAQN